LGGSQGGGDGGDPGLPGQNGITSPASAGGIAGKYIDGIANVIMGSPQGDLRGNVA
jgi:hypothetical protein